MSVVRRVAFLPAGLANYAAPQIALPAFYRELRRKFGRTKKTRDAAGGRAEISCPLVLRFCYILQEDDARIPTLQK